jgi:hypothetical protein
MLHEPATRLHQALLQTRSATGPGVGAVSEKSATNGTIPGVRDLVRARTGFRGGLPGRFGQKTGPGSSGRRSSRSKTEISGQMFFCRHSDGLFVPNRLTGRFVSPFYLVILSGKGGEN